MSEWRRKTKEVTLGSLPAEVTLALQEHLERHNLGPILSDALMCIQTDSEKTKKGLFGSPKTVQIVAVITPRWILWAVDQPEAKPAVLSAQLIHVTVQDYAQTPFVKMVADSGIQVNGMFTDAGESASAFIGLEENAAGQKFRDLVIRTTAAAKK